MNNSVFTIPFLFVFLAFQISCSQTDLINSNSTSANLSNSAAINTNSIAANTNSAEPPKTLDANAQRSNLKAQAEEASQTIKNHDYAKLADYTHPKALEGQGGREKLIAESKEAIEQLKREGFEIISVEIGEPEEIVAIENELFAVVPLTAIVKAPKGKMKQSSSIVGISDNNGANWKFVNGINQEKFKEMFPNAAAKVRIPQDALTPVKDK